MSMHIIDRRKNPKSKSLSNRRRFMDRVKSSIKASAKKAVGRRSINDESATNVKVSGGNTKQERFVHDDKTGNQDYVVTGNEHYDVGDKIYKPPMGGSSGSGSGGKGEIGQDEFEFAISYEEFLDVIFEDLELPNLEKSSAKNSVILEQQRAGYTTTGIPANLNIEKTMISGISRRIALKNPKLAQIEELEKKLEETTDEVRRTEIEEEIRVLRARAQAISFLDDIDLRYNNRILVKKPVSQAVMFCVMDVSFSMEEEHKIIAKKFFLLLNRFLRRQYKNVDVVFIRHHQLASECDEVTFFTDREGGGTTVSPAYELTWDIIKKRYPATDWNIYIAQISDGDNDPDDHEECVVGIEKLLPLSQFMMYLEVRPENSWGGSHKGMTELGEVISPLCTAHPDMLFMDRITNETQIVPVFRKIFAKR